MSWCDDNWYNTHRYSDDTFAVLQPQKAIDCSDESATKPSDREEEFKTMAAISMFLGLIFLVFVLYRSCTREYVDWYRLIGVYVLGTIGVPVSVFVGPKHAGFNRIVGFGILIHNLAELFILQRLWIGRRYFNAIFAIFYVWLVMSLNTFLDLAALFLILMIQGASCDWILVYSFAYLGQWLKKNEWGKEHRKKMGSIYWFGLVAAFCHIITIQPLFFGFALSKSALSGITVIFLVPTFIFYIIFAASDDDHIPVIISNPGGPRLADSETKNLKEKELDNMAEEKKDPDRADNNKKDDEKKNEKLWLCCTLWIT